MNVKGEATTARHMETRMAARSGRSPPPDLPSLLLDGRIVYLGMPVSASSLCQLVVTGCLSYQNNQRRQLHNALSVHGTV